MRVPGSTPTRTSPSRWTAARKMVQLTFRVARRLKGDDVDRGMLPQYLPGPIGVQEVQPGTPA